MNVVQNTVVSRQYSRALPPTIKTTPTLAIPDKKYSSITGQCHGFWSPGYVHREDICIHGMDHSARKDLNYSGILVLKNHKKIQYVSYTRSAQQGFTSLKCQHYFVIYPLDLNGGGYK